MAIIHSKDSYFNSSYDSRGMETNVSTEYEINTSSEDVSTVTKAKSHYLESQSSGDGFGTLQFENINTIDSYQTENSKMDKLSFRQHFKQSQEVEDEFRCFEREPLTNPASLNDTQLKYSNQFKPTINLRKSSSCFGYRIVRSLSYLLMLLACLLCYASQSYVATFGDGLVSFIFIFFSFIK